MTKKITVLLALLALAALGLAACGGDDETTSSSAATTSEETTAADSGGAAETIEVSADPDGALAFTTTDLSAKAGAAEISFDNPSSTPHDVRIESSDGADIGGTEEVTGGTATATVDLEPGTYTYFCSVDGHRAAGMEGTLTVK
jgi:plastocyanin